MPVSTLKREVLISSLESLPTAQACQVGTKTGEEGAEPPAQRARLGPKPPQGGADRSAGCPASPGRPPPPPRCAYRKPGQAPPARPPSPRPESGGRRGHPRERSRLEH